MLFNSWEYLIFFPLITISYFILPYDWRWFLLLASSYFFYGMWKWEYIFLTVATFFFAFQIYCDFSGYSDIAVGSAKILGINLMENFMRPYFATSIRDFWRRYQNLPRDWKELSVRNTQGWKSFGQYDPHNARVITKAGIKEYKKHFSEGYFFSNHRLDSLKEIINFCSSRGKVILVRLPTSEPMRQLEEN
jgi:hypothetical protein